MNRYFLAALMLVSLLCIPSAWATDNQIIPPGPGDCDATMTWDQCQAFLAGGGTSGGTGTGSGGWWCFWCPDSRPPKQDCSKLSNTTCKECKSVCDCGYANAI